MTKRNNRRNNQHNQNTQNQQSTVSGDESLLNISEEVVETPEGEAPAVEAPVNTVEETQPEEKAPAPVAAPAVTVKDTSAPEPKPQSVPANLQRKRAVALNDSRISQIVAIFKDFGDKTGKNQILNKEVKRKTADLNGAIRLLLTMDGPSIRECLKQVCAGIAANKTGAFSNQLLFRFVEDSVSGKAMIRPSERQRFISFLTLLTVYSRLEDKSKITTRVDLKTALKPIIKTESAYSAVFGFFNA